MTISEGFKRVRKVKGYSQQACAKAANVSVTQYQNYEYGKSEPTAKVLIALADFYGVSIDYLVGRTDEPFIYRVHVD